MQEAMKEMDKKKKLVPKLRFKRYTDSWKKGTIGDYYQNLRTGMTPSRTRPDYFKGNIPWISSGELNYGFIEKTTESITQEAIENTNLRIYPTNTLFIAITGLEAPGTRGKCAINKVPAATNQSCLAFEEIEDVSTLFLFQWYKKNGIWLYFNFAQGTKQQSFNNKLISGFTFNIPTLPEQQKIASFLSAVDEKIQQLTRKKELLEQYKKGVMQQLFSGKLRFKDKNGKAFPKWEEKLYEDIFSFYTTNSFSRENLNYDSGKVKNIHYGDIHTKFSSRFEIKEEVLPYINENVDLSKLKEENFCQEGDLVIADASEDYADIGKAIELIKLDKEKIVAGLHTFLARPNKNKMHIGFSGYLVQAYYVRKQVMTIAQGTKVLSISHGRLGKVKLKIPCIEEQQKIASFLTSIDVKIESVTIQVAQTHMFKKGLLQQMFV